MIFVKKALGVTVLAVESHEQQVLGMFVGRKQVVNIKFVKRSWSDIKQAIAERVQYAVDVVTRRTVYYYHSGRDCDGVEYGGPVKYENRLVAEKSMDEAYDWADGPMHFARITAKEYADAESYSRDRYAEMMNY